MTTKIFKIYEITENGLKEVSICNETQLNVKLAYIVRTTAKKYKVIPQ